MNNIVNFNCYFKLNEDKKSDFMSSFNNIKPEYLEKIWDIDPSSSKKYIKKLAKFFLDGYNLDLLGDLIKMYDNLLLRNAIDIKDINKFNNFQEFEDAILFADSKKSKSSLKKDIKKNEEKHDLIFENDKCYIYRIFSHKSSCILGKGTKWCITMSNTSQHWEYYNYKLNLDFYFIIMKPSIKVDKKYSKMAVGIDLRNNPYEVRDLNDATIPFEKVLSITKAPKELFINTFLNTPINKDDLETKLLKLKIKNFYIKDDMSVVIKEDLTLENISYLPFKILKIEGDFIIKDCDLKNSDFFPNEVKNNVNILYNNYNFDEIFIPNCKNLVLDCNTLHGIKNNYLVELNIIFKKVNTEDLTSFNIQPIINGDLMIIDGSFKSLKGISKEVKGNCVLFNNKIESLEYSPDKIGKTYDISYNKITSLEHLPDNIGKLINKGNKI